MECESSVDLRLKLILFSGCFQCEMMGCDIRGKEALVVGRLEIINLSDEPFTISQTLSTHIARERNLG